MSDNYHRITITKRDGKKEAYDPNKIIQVAEAAGLDTHLAVQLAQAISDWLSGLKKSHVSSLDLRDRIQKDLHRLSPHVSDLYRWYQKTKDIKRRG